MPPSPTGHAGNFDFAVAMFGPFLVLGVGQVPYQVGGLGAGRGGGIAAAASYSEGAKAAYLKKYHADIERLWAQENTVG